jgi:hypothetical protein
MENLLGFGSKADIAALSWDVCFTPESGHWRTTLGCPLCAKSGHQFGWKTALAIFNVVPRD